MSGFSFLIPPDPQQAPRDITPPNWGPPSGTWQPNPPVPPTIVTNFDGDGATDYQLPGGDILPGGGDIHFGAIVLDNLGITFILWRDKDGDGIIDRNEVFNIVGQCVFSNAVNYTGVYKDPSNNHRHVGVGNKTLRPNTEYGVPPGGAIGYDYDVETGKLVVTKVIPYPNGTATVVYNGSASGYDWKWI